MNKVIGSGKRLLLFSPSLLEVVVNAALWQMIIVNIITPSFPFIFPLRMAVTAGAVSSTPWWLVLIVANGVGGLGMLPVYALARWKTPEDWHQRVEGYRVIQNIRSVLRSNMFLTQVLLNATPLPDAISSALAGSERYPIWKFLLSQLVGRTFHNLPLVIGGLWLAKQAWFMASIATLRQPMTWITISGVSILLWLITSRKIQKPQAAK